MAADWLKIKSEYLAGCGSMRELAQKYGVSESSIRHKSASEGWKTDRANTAQALHKKTVQKIVQKTAEKESDRISRVLSAGDALLGKLERAAAELGTVRMVKSRESTSQRAEDGAFITRETAVELAQKGDAPISSTAVRQLSAALCDLMKVVQAAQPAVPDRQEAQDDPLTKSLREEAERLNDGAID